MRRPLLLASVAAILLPAAACSEGSSSGDGSGRPTVAAAFYPLQYLAQEVGGDAIDVVTLVPPGSEAHEYEPTPKQLTALADASLVLYLGNDFQPSLQKAIGTLPSSARKVDLLTSVPLLPFGQEIGQGSNEEDHGELDPHVWLSPANMRLMAAAVADALAELVPDQAAVIRGNATALEARLTALDAAMTAGLARCESPYLVTGHHAFGYLADQYGLTQVSIAGLSPAEEPSAATLEDVAAFAAEHDVTTIFFEENLPSDLSRTVADEIGASTAVLDTLESPSQAALDTGEDYDSLMRENLVVLREGLRCA